MPFRTSTIHFKLLLSRYSYPSVGFTKVLSVSSTRVSSLINAKASLGNTDVGENLTVNSYSSSPSIAFLFIEIALIQD